MQKDKLLTASYECLHNLAEQKPFLITKELVQMLNHISMNEAVKVPVEVKYRSSNDISLENGYCPPDFLEIPHLMEHFESQAELSRVMFDFLEFAVICHKRILDICPYEKNNFETAWLLFNVIIMSEGYGYVDFAEDQRNEYFYKLKKAQTSTYPEIDELVTMMRHLIEKE